MSLAAEFAATYPADEAAALAILSEHLGHLGTGAVIKPPLWVDYGTHLQVRDETFINTGLVVLDAAPVTIGPARVVKEV